VFENKHAKFNGIVFLRIKKYYTFSDTPQKKSEKRRGKKDKMCRGGRHCPLIK
jgi:hypothetical protein